jgi:hypothetical protein
MPFPCRAHAVSLPRRAAKGLDCVFPHLIYTVRPSLIHTCHAAPVPCHDYAVLKATFQGRGTARHGRGMSAAWARHGYGMCEFASAVQRQHMGDLPAFWFLPATTRSSTKVVIRSILIR